MGFIENMRQWTSNRFDDITGQENIYHKSTGKTQKEYENDLDFYKDYEKAVGAGAAGLGALGGTALGVGSAAGMGLPWVISNAASDEIAAGFLTALVTALQKKYDNAKNGGTPEKREF